MNSLKNIVLIGMSGVGKTTVGDALSRALNREFLDIDSLIEREANTSIENIFSIYGEVYFRELESNIVKQIYQDKNLIISTGGGIVLVKDNIDRLRENGIIVLLEGTIDYIINNIKKSKNNRPLLNGVDIQEKVKSIYNNRKELYLSAGDFIVLVNNKSVDEIVYEILERCVKINS